MSAEVLVATDLDRTLIYSTAAAGPPRPGDAPWVVVERLDGRVVSSMTEVAAGRYAALATRWCVVPVTTRTPAQYARVQLPGPPPRYAVAANGGMLLVDGAVDPCWSDRVRASLSAVAALDEARASLAHACREDAGARLHTVPDLFCYAVVDRARLPATAVADLRAWGSVAGWGVSLQGRKLYLVPSPLTKSSAVAEVVARTGAHTVLAAGDSILDIDLLEFADLGVRPGHGEILDTGWSSPSVHALGTAGIHAGEEVLTWFAQQAERVVGGPASGVRGSMGSDRPRTPRR